MCRYQHLQQNAALQRQRLRLYHSQRSAIHKQPRLRDIPSRFPPRFSSEAVSDPDISFEVIKEDSRNYSAAVTCRSASGTPPVTFSLYNRTELVTVMTSEDREATVKLPLVLGVHMGWLQCRANNGDQTASSKWLPVEVGKNVSGTRRFENVHHGFCFTVCNVSNSASQWSRDHEL